MECLGQLFEFVVIVIVIIYFFSQVVDHIFLRVKTNFSTSIFLGRVNIFRI